MHIRIHAHISMSAFKKPCVLAAGWRVPGLKKAEC